MIACTGKRVEKTAVSFDLSNTSDSLVVFGPGLISTSLYERDFAISPDGNELMYTLGTYDQSRRCIVSMQKNGNGWESQQIASFSGVYQDIEPFYAPDGRTLFFASDRPMPGDSTIGDYNIWKTQRVNGVWSEPVALSNLINTDGGEFYPAVSRNGNLYFTATRADGIGREDIFLSRYVNGEYQPPTVLDSNINTVTYEFNAYISPDEDLLIFSSYGRPDELGGGDLYFSRKKSDGSWESSESMGAIVNSNKLDYCPFVDFTGGNFYFTSERTETYEAKITSVEELSNLANSPMNGKGNVFRVGLEQIGLK